MTIPTTIKRYGELEVVYVHAHVVGDQWHLTHSRIHPSGCRVLGMYYLHKRNTKDDLERALKRYVKFMENYYSI